MKKLILSGKKLSLDALVEFSRRIPNDIELLLDKDVEERVEKAAEWVEEKVRSGAAVYGVTTGFGSN